MIWSKEWHYVVFPDENKFNAEGPDGYSHYYHDLRKEELILDRLHSRVGGVILWVAISYNVPCELQFITPKINAKDYNRLLKIAFPYFKNVVGNLEWHFQHDNAPIHTARSVKTWIQNGNVKWPP